MRATELTNRLKRSAKIILHPDLPLVVKGHLLALEVRMGDRDRAAHRHLRIGPCVVIVADRIDYLTMFGAFVDEVFRADLEGAVVVDVGAHHGYFAAYALWKGAAGVVSFEPQSANYQILQCSWALSTAAQPRWRTFRPGVAATASVMELQVSSRSRSHSFRPGRGKEAVAVERVEMIPLGEAVEQAQELSPGAPIVVKLNVEGMAGEIILATESAVWRSVHEVVFDWERWTTEALGDVVEHLEAAGLHRTWSDGRRHRFRTTQGHDEGTRP